MNMLAPPTDCGGTSRQNLACTGCRPQRGQQASVELAGHAEDASQPSTEILAEHDQHRPQAHHLTTGSAALCLLEISPTEATVRQVLRDSPYREHTLLEVHLNGAELELRGETSSFYMKQMAQELAKLAAPKVRIRNLVQVRG